MKSWNYWMVAIYGMLPMTVHAQAQDRWIQVLNDSNVTIAFDRQTATIKSGIVTAWTRWVWNTTQLDHTTYIQFRSAKVKQRYDCKTHQTAEISGSYYDSTGTVVHSFTGSNVFVEQTPETLGEAVTDTICAHAPKPSVAKRHKPQSQ